ncbi:T9SS type B sorting domain-containing protein [Urechidicola croceus]|uniref:PKD domain-containing protein n=1 Tax=Urechidicola croceus TaxID=1850246 RepID=A0A1D8PA95_9FLAO|nr:T9SS type B sorting domain-containing protein [Urechidicola croceus]AOW21514.1 hypothetical protein LPB138_12865 [Urechidicola croceus]
MKKQLILYTFLLISFVLYSQKEANIWYFGENAGVDFNSGVPVSLTDGQLNTREGCTSISDANGNLLFYSDGITVWNRNHQVMLNGTDLLGNSDSTQSAIIIPKPNDPNLYYIFTTDKQGGTKGLNYSEVDLTLDGGLGAITNVKNINLIPQCTEQVTAVHHQNEVDIWVIAHPWESNKFNSFLITSSGINSVPVESTTSLMLPPPDITGSGSATGQLKISPTGNKLGINNGEIGTHLFDFDNQTGVVSNLLQISSRKYNYGIEFSPSGKRLYIAGYDNYSSSTAFTYILQYNLDASNIAASEVLITNYYGVAFSLQLAPNNKIYAAKGGKFLSSIENPNAVGLSCNFIEDSVDLGIRNCVAGLPPFIQSYFTVSLSYQNICLGDATEFNLNTTVDSVTWDFGDPASGIDNTSTDIEPTHIFSSPGTYTVTATAISGGETAESEIDVIIFETPIAHPIDDIILCDTEQDGFVIFDTTTLEDNILNGQDPDLFEVIYYDGISNYNDNVPMEHPDMFELLTFSNADPVISVRNKNNPTCEDSMSFNISVIESPLINLNIIDLPLCDNTTVGTDTDGFIEIDLTQKEEEILNWETQPDYNITYFTDNLYTDEILNPTTYQNTNTTETIYVNVTNTSHSNNSCDSKTSFNLVVNALPTITPTVELKQCDDDNNGFSLFNLEEVIDKISANYLNETITFHETLALAESGNSPIPNTITYTNETVSTDTIWARVENVDGCYKTSQVNLIVSTTLIPSSFQRNFYQCDDDTDGIATFDFSSVNTEIEALFPVGQQLDITYYRNVDDALAEENFITDISNYENSGYPNSQDIYVRVDSQLDNSCLGLGAHISLTVETVPVANPVTIPEQCDPDGDGLYEFDTSTIESTIIGTQTDVDVFYVAENGDALPSPLPNPFQTTSQTITVRVENTLSQDPNGRCFDETTINFSVDAAAVANPIGNLIECDDDIDGLFPFDTSAIEDIVLNGQTDMIVSYTDSQGNVLSSPLPNPFLSGNETINVRVENPLNTICYDETSFELIVRDRPQFELDDEDVICINESPSLTITTQNAIHTESYEWTDSDGTIISTDASATVTEGGIYSVIAISSLGCESFPQEITINESEKATITQEMITIIDDSDNNSISIDISNLGSGDYEFSLGEEFGDYQDEPIFENVPAGIHTVYVQDKNNCGITPIQVSVIGYPKYFTPNNDGVNDTWNVKGTNSNFYGNSIIYIYDRFGKIVANILPNSEGWNGLNNGKELPATDYWFKVEFIDEDGTSFIRKGHFSLIRRGY